MCQTHTAVPRDAGQALAMVRTGLDWLAAAWKTALRQVGPDRAVRALGLDPGHQVAIGANLFDGRLGELRQLQAGRRSPHSSLYSDAIFESVPCQERLLRQGVGAAERPRPGRASPGFSTMASRLGRWPRPGRRASSHAARPEKLFQVGEKRR